MTANPYCVNAYEHQKHDRYNGWTNRETWALNLWLTNDESLLDSAIADIAVVYAENFNGAIYQPLVNACAEALENWWNETTLPQACEPVTYDMFLMLHDIGSIYRVNFAEIVDHLMRDNQLFSLIADGWWRDCEECGSKAQTACDPLCTAIDTALNA